MKLTGPSGGELEVSQQEATPSSSASRTLSMRTNGSSGSPSSSLSMLFPRQSGQKRSTSYSSSIGPISPEEPTPASTHNESKIDTEVAGSDSPSSMKPPLSFTDSKISIRSLLGSSDPYSDATRSESKAMSSPVDKSSMPFPKSNKAGLFEKNTLLRKEGEETRRMRSIDLYHPSLRQPLNPRDHSLLERIYTEMHEDRFINLKPLSVMAMCVEMHFTRRSLDD